MTVTELKYTMIRILAAFALLVYALPSHAKLEIEIIQGNAAALPIAIVPFQWRAAGQPPITTITEVISSDLYRSGLFSPMDEADMVDRPADGESIRFGTWRLLRVDYIVIGWVNDAPGGSGYDIVYQLFELFFTGGQKKITGVFTFRYRSKSDIYALREADVQGPVGGFNAGNVTIEK